MPQKNPAVNTENSRIILHKNLSVNTEINVVIALSEVLVFLSLRNLNIPRSMLFRVETDYL
jgi:hypothetical protein